MIMIGSLLGACGGQTLDVGSNRPVNEDTISLGGETSSGGRTGGGDAGAGTIEPEPQCPCSRRPGVSNSFRCPRGVDESTTAVIGPEGGAIRLLGQQGASSGVAFALEAPPNALAEDVKIVLTETSAAPPAELIDYSPVFVLEPKDVQSRFPLKLTIPFGNGDGTYAGLAIYVAPTQAGPFELLADSYMNAGFMQGSTTQFGAFFVGSPRSPEQVGCP